MMVSFYPSPVSPKGEKLKPSSNEALIWKTITIINQPAPFPNGKGGGIGPITPKIHHHRGKVPLPFLFPPPFGLT